MVRMSQQPVVLVLVCVLKHPHVYHLTTTWYFSLAMHESVQLVLHITATASYESQTNGNQSWKVLLLEQSQSLIVVMSTKGATSSSRKRKRLASRERFQPANGQWSQSRWLPTNDDQMHMSMYCGWCREYQCWLRMGFIPGCSSMKRSGSAVIWSVAQTTTFTLTIPSMPAWFGTARHPFLCKCRPTWDVLGCTVPCRRGWKVMLTRLTWHDTGSTCSVNRSCQHLLLKISSSCVQVNQR